MDVDHFIAVLESDGVALAAAATSAGLDASVPGTDWTIRELVTHVGGVHRWAADILGSRSSTRDTSARAEVGVARPDETLIDWFLDGHAGLVRTLRAAPSDLACFTFMPAPSPLAFWARRQAHETAIHRADAQHAAKVEVGFSVEFAQDGIDELVNGFARGRHHAFSTAATLALRPNDTGDDWLIIFGGERITAERRVSGPVDATVSGSSGDLYQWVWNRPSTVTVSGDASVAELWRTVQVRWG